jgi:hypothetical protein
MSDRGKPRGAITDAASPQALPKIPVDPQKAAVASLLASHDGSLDDKLATLKTAHHIDKDRVQSAFRRLMTGG